MSYKCGCFIFFCQAAGERSKTVILAKNLPAGTKAEELTEIFSKFGSLGRVILPPSGITAIIEYIEPYEAKQGFTKLAYTKVDSATKEDFVCVHVHACM